MNKDALIRKIKAKAKQDEEYRRDRRFLEAMGFLVAKGFLKTNLDMPLLPNKRLRVEDVIWAGLNVEPRILEVLPAAVLRLAKHFDLDPAVHRELAETVDQLRRRKENGKAFYGMPYEKVRVWVDFPLRDKRVKPLTKRKVVKTFRLDPTAVENLRRVAEQKGCTETEILETLLLRA